jgi:hypothetical protein
VVVAEAPAGPRNPFLRDYRSNGDPWAAYATRPVPQPRWRRLVKAAAWSLAVSVAKTLGLGAVMWAAGSVAPYVMPLLAPAIR